MTGTQPTPLTKEQLSEVLKLIKWADSVELKLTVPDVDRRSTVAALEMDPVEAQIRQKVFAETRAFLAEPRVNLTGEQQTKTRTALVFFSHELQNAGGSDAEARR